MTCPNCGSNHVNVQTATYVRDKRRSCLWNLLWFCCIGWWWLIWMMIRGRKQKIEQRTTCTCQNCGNVWWIG